jgi:hypothetical protein
MEAGCKTVIYAETDQTGNADWYLLVAAASIFPPREALIPTKPRDVVSR